MKINIRNKIIYFLLFVSVFFLLYNNKSITNEPYNAIGDNSVDETGKNKFNVSVSALETLAPVLKISNDNNYSGPDLYLVRRVKDGDTIELENGEVVRYIGIDTPESVHPRRPIECFGIEASLKNKELVEGKRVRLEKDITDRDKYGRLLRYVYIEDQKSGFEADFFVNLELVKEGYASVYTYPPDVKYNELFLEAQKNARENNLGLWNACSNQDYKYPIISNESDLRNPDCQIKGNINAQGEKIYHLPNCSYYSKTKIDENRGEKWFCGEEEALTAGWRKALNCP